MRPCAEVTYLIAWLQKLDILECGCIVCPLLPRHRGSTRVIGVTRVSTGIRPIDVRATGCEKRSIRLLIDLCSCT